MLGTMRLSTAFRGGDAPAFCRTALQISGWSLTGAMSGATSRESNDPPPGHVVFRGRCHPWYSRQSRSAPASFTREIWWHPCCPAHSSSNDRRKIRSPCCPCPHYSPLHYRPAVKHARTKLHQRTYRVFGQDSVIYPSAACGVNHAPRHSFLHSAAFRFSWCSTFLFPEECFSVCVAGLPCLASREFHHNSRVNLRTKTVTSGDNGHKKHTFPVNPLLSRKR
jgi:hypothetical protein